MFKNVKIPRIPMAICKIGKFFIAIAKVILIGLIAWFDFPKGTDFATMQNASIFFGAICMLIFVLLEALRVLLDEAECKKAQTTVSNFVFFISTRCAITAGIMLFVMLVLPSIIKFQGDPIEVTKQVAGKNIIQTENVYKYVEASPQKPLYPIDLEQNGVVVISVSNADVDFVQDFISNNDDLLASHTVMFNNGALNALPEGQNLAELEFYDTPTSISELLGSQDITSDVLYVGSPNLSGYSDSIEKHDTRLIVVTPVGVTAEEQSLLNESFEKVKIISIETIK